MKTLTIEQSEKLKDYWQESALNLVIENCKHIDTIEKQEKIIERLNKVIKRLKQEREELNHLEAIK